MLNNLKIGVRLGIGFAITLILLLVIGAVSYTRLAALNVEIDGLVRDKFPKTVQANDIIDAVNSIARNLRNAYIFSGDDRQKALDVIPEQRKIISDRLEKLDKSVTSEKGKEGLAKVKAARTAYVAHQDKFMELLKTDKKAELLTLLQGDMAKTQDAYVKSVNEMVDLQTELMEAAGKDADSMVASTERMLLILSAVATLLAVLVGWLITRSITGPTNNLVQGADKMAAGDFSFKLDVDSKDEVGMLAKSVRAMQASVQAMITDANMLAKAAVDGKLETRADASKHQGDFQAIVAGVNPEYSLR